MTKVRVILHQNHEHEAASSIEQGDMLHHGNAGVEDQEVYELGYFASFEEEVLLHQKEAADVEDQVEEESGLGIAEEHGMIDDGCYVDICSCDGELWRLVVGKHILDFLTGVYLSHRLRFRPDDVVPDTRNTQTDSSQLVGQIEHVQVQHHQQHCELII